MCNTDTRYVLSKKREDATEVLIHWARQKVAGDPVVSQNLKWLRTDICCKQSCYLPVKLTVCHSSKQSYLSQKPLRFPVLHIKTLNHQSNSQNTRSRRFVLSLFFTHNIHQMLLHSLSNIFMHTTDPFQEPGFSQLLFLLQCG